MVSCPGLSNSSPTAAGISPNSVTFGIVTALPKEYAAVKVMLDDPVDHWTPKGRVYVLGSIPAKGEGTHHVALMLSNQGTAVASHSATLLVEDFPGTNAILMVGIAGGVPDVAKPARHVRLGDIVVSGDQGIVAYDFGKEHQDRFEARLPPRPPHARLLQACRRLDAIAYENQFPWLSHLPRAAHLLHSARPPAETDRLASSSNATVYLDHPPDPDRRPDQPRVFIGTVACANRLLKNPVTRDQLRDQYDVRAVEMEGFGIAEATWNQDIGYIVVRGVCDYCDSNKGDAWQGHAAIIAGAYARAVLEETPCIGPAHGTEIVQESGARSAIPVRDLRGLATALLESGAPRSVITLLSDVASGAKRALDQLGTVRRTITSVDGKQTSALHEIFLTQERHHLLVAPPGSGKTHALWRSARDLLASEQLIPIYLPVGIAQTWTQVLEMVAGAPQGLDPGQVLVDSRICVILDGWTEFASQADARDSAAALRALNLTQVVASGRKCPEQITGFNIWSLDPLPTSAVTAAIRTSFPNPPQIDPALAELLRLPLALSLYLVLGGSARSRGELLASFHKQLSRGLPDEFLRVLGGAVSVVSLPPGGRSWARLGEELRLRSSSESISDPSLQLDRLGTLEARSGMVVPIHDLYWSWLSGVGILGENRISAALPFLSTRESIDLALESGVRPNGTDIRTAIDLDILAAAQMSANLPVDDPVLPEVATTISRMLDDPSMATRVRGALAALKSRDEQFLVPALKVVTSVREFGVYEAAFEACLDLDWLFTNRGVIAEWIGALGTDQLLEAIAVRGDPRWGDWLAQMATAGKISFPDAVGVALACQATIPVWVAEHLLSFIRQESYRLRAVAARGKNREIARWLADHYAECVDLSQGAFVDINHVLVACADDSTFERLLDLFPRLPAEAQERLGFAVRVKGDPWLGRFQQLAFGGGAWSHHHELLRAVSGIVDDTTARTWIGSGPAVLGWRVLIARHGNAVVSELLHHLPPSFDGLHVIPALEAMAYLKDAPEGLTDEIWMRVHGTMQPKAMQDVLLALAAIRNTGLASVVKQLAQNPFFLPTYHLVLFLNLLRKWESDTGLRINVRSGDGRDLAFIDWLLSLWLPANVKDPNLRYELAKIRDVAVPALLALFDNDKDAYAKLIVTCGSLDRYNEKLVQHLLSEATGPKVICEQFSSSLDTFPETVLLDLLDAKGLDLRTYVGALASSSTPIHRTLHAKIIRKTLDGPFNEWLFRDVARILSVHPRSALLKLLKEHITPTAASDLWLVREIERASGQLLIRENGDWLS